MSKTIEEFNDSMLNVKKDSDGKVISFDITRRFWGTTYLFGNDGKMCCMGFYGRACGASLKLMKSCGYLRTSMLPASTIGWLMSSHNANYPAADDVAEMLANINDSMTISQKDKERQIKKIFNNHGITVNFVD